MRKIIGIGETILDVLFKNNQPVKALPGGSVFNSIISLGRLGANTMLVSETGCDYVGDMVVATLEENGVDTSCLYRYCDAKSPISLAFLTENNDADYLFYKDNPSNHLDIEYPSVNVNDIVIYGSYFVLNPVLRNKVKAFLEYAKNSGAILYYDVNFRKNHESEKLKLSEAVIENLEFADVVRGSIDDFKVLFGMDDAVKIYTQKIKFYCPNFICTHGGDKVLLLTKTLKKCYETPSVKVVSSIGAGDNFNAGVAYAMLVSDVFQNNILSLSLEQWDMIVGCGIDLSSYACTIIDNYIDKSWADNYKLSK